MRSTTINTHKGSGTAGYSLVELMVATVIFGMSVTGVMSMIGIGREIESENGIRRQARMAATGMLENNNYLNSSYPNYNQNFGFWSALEVGTGYSVPDTVNVRVTSEIFEAMNEMGGGPSVMVPYKLMEVKIRWSLAGRIDTAYAQKRLVDLQ